MWPAKGPERTSFKEEEEEKNCRKRKFFNRFGIEVSVADNLNFRRREKVLGNRMNYKWGWSGVCVGHRRSKKHWEKCWEQTKKENFPNEKGPEVVVVTTDDSHSQVQTKACLLIELDLRWLPFNSIAPLSDPFFLVAFSTMAHTKPAEFLFAKLVVFRFDVRLFLLRSKAATSRANERRAESVFLWSNGRGDHFKDAGCRVAILAQKSDD